MKLKANIILNKNTDYNQTKTYQVQENSNSNQTRKKSFFQKLSDSEVNKKVDIKEKLHNRHVIPFDKDNKKKINRKFTKVTKFHINRRFDKIENRSNFVYYIS